MKQLKIFISFCLLCLVIASCNREDVPFEGPALVDLFGEFSFLEEFEIANRSIDFAVGQSTYFTAQFSKTSDWEIYITGQESGAVKILTGTSNFLDASNSTWNGSITQIPEFKPENCIVELRIVADTVLILDSLSITTSKPASGFVVADFESGLDPAWNVFAQSGGNMSFEVLNDIPAGQGDFYYDMGGEVDWDWLIGLLDIPATAFGSNTFPLSDNPDEVYFNFYVYKAPGITNELLLFQFKEDENEDGSFVGSAEDLYAIEYSNLQEGWQTISVKYGDLVNLVNGQPAAPNGNGVHDPDKIGLISILMLADPSSGYSQVLIDNIVFTEGAPLNP